MACTPVRTWVTVPGAEPARSLHRVWIGIDDDEIGTLALGQRGEDVLDIGFGRQQHARIGGAEPLRPQSHLGDGLFARDIDHAVALPCQRCRGLHQQCRLADARIAAHQYCRSADKTASGDAVEFADPGRNARRFLDLACQAGERHRPALAGRRAGTATDAAGRVVLNDGVPFAAAITLARPAGMDGAAGLTDELNAGLGQGSDTSLF
jgi:hypothetical protein